MSDSTFEPPSLVREQRRLRRRRKRRRAFIRSVYSLPSLATLGNAICGFAAIYIAGLSESKDTLGNWFIEHRFFAAAAMIFIAMLFDALDGRLARFTRHTTDFGGQLDSLADVISFGAAPAFIGLYLFKIYAADAWHVPSLVTRLVWVVGAIYMSCAAVRLARFNVSNEHGEQHHFSFLGLPSPGAAGAVVAVVMLHQSLHGAFPEHPWLSDACVWLLPVILLSSGLLMVSTIRYPHLINRYLRGRKSVGALIAILICILLLVIEPIYTLVAGLLIYAYCGAASYGIARWRRRGLRPARFAPSIPAAAPSAPPAPPASAGIAPMPPAPPSDAPALPQPPQNP